MVAYVEGSSDRNVAIAVKRHLEHLECKRQWKAGSIVGGYTFPVREEILRRGGLWFARHKAWMMPDHESWKYIQSLLPGDF
jgi:hypothetical protein